MLRRVLTVVISMLLSASAVHATTGVTAASLSLSSGSAVELLSGTFATRSGFALSPDHQICATASSGGFGVVRLWQTQTGQKLYELKAKVPPGPLLLWLAFSPDGSLLACGANSALAPADGTVQVWDVRTGTLMETLDGLGPVCFSPDGKLLASGDRGNAVHIWDPRTGQPVRMFARQSSRLASLAFSPDGDTLATECGSGVRLWDVRSGALKPVQAKASLWGTRAVSFTPDGKTLVIGGTVLTSDSSAGSGSQGEVQLCDVQTGQLQQTFRTKGRQVRSLAITPSATMLAVGTDEGTVHLWDMSSGQEARAMNGDRTTVDALAFLRSDTTLLEWSEAGPTQLWEVRTGNKLGALKIR